MRTPQRDCGGRPAPALVDLLDGYAGLDVLVVGDAILDGWLRGPSQRLSREAPVPVIDIEETLFAPGGAANAAAAVSALGARLHFVTVLGDDADGELLKQAMAAAGVPSADVVTAAGRRTAAKRRLCSGTQIVARFDTGDAGPPPIDVSHRLLDRLDALYPLADVVLLCDYAHGLFGPVLRRRVADLQRAAPRVLVVDARNPAVWAEARPVAVTPNWPETVALLGRTEGPEAGRPEVVAAGADRLLAATGARLVAATLDSDGVLLLEHGRPPYRLSTEPAPHAQSAGAGDSFAAAFALALGAGADGPAASELGTAAASVVVRRPGTAVCTAGELRDAVAGRRHVLLEDLRELAECVGAHRAAGRRVVFTNGCFDVLHPGHVGYLDEARALGEVLIVGLNSDDSVRRLKGAGRPVNPAADRAAVLAALSCVDHVVVFEGDTAADVLTIVRPDVYVKGGDYLPEMVPEASLVTRLGGRVQILQYREDTSTTSLLERIRSMTS